ncbi:hypothetical protein L2E82_30382 [Cichorium intybus]|uniref:Uncharacterized protein n=1 Tax=Cichorium intybus TaxID=13427 RepID=A0ACB9D0N4_CICIN|nr:hypothetical protein L2E82_30382 [Cichorium intybus]
MHLHSTYLGTDQSANRFKETNHACESYRHAIKFITLENGKSLLEVLEICKSSALETLEVALQTVISSLPVKGPSICTNSNVNNVLIYLNLYTSLGEYDVEKLISSTLEDEESLTIFSLSETLLGNLAINVDARPSDALNVAKRCRAPIYLYYVLAEELDLVAKMNIAVKDERYSDAGTKGTAMLSRLECLPVTTYLNALV